MLKTNHYKIKEISEVINGSTPSTKELDNYDGEIIWLTPKDLSDQKSKYIYRGERNITQKGYSSCGTKMIPPHNIIMSSRAPIGLLSINKNECCTNQGFKSLILDKDLADTNFMYYFIKHHMPQIEALGSGTTFKEVSKDSMENYEVDIPDLPTQKKIADVLSCIDDKIALNNKTNNELENMAKTVYDYWFTQFDFPDANGKPYKASGGKMEYNQVLKREIPAGWEVKRLGDLFSTNRGVSYNTKSITAENGIPMINLASFSPTGKYKIDGLKTFAGDYAEEKKLKPYDLVMCNTQQTAIDFSKDIIGKVLLVPDIFDGDIVSSHHVNTIRFHNENLKLYFFRFFNTDFFHKYISNFANGTSILGLVFSGVEDYMSVIPPESVLNNFNKLMIDIEKKKNVIIRETEELTKLRDFLLPLLMNGQIEVK